MSTALKTSSRSLEIVPQSDLDDINKLDQASREASRLLIQAEIARNDMSKGLILARSMKMLRSLLTERVMSDVMELMNTPLGFKTDRDPARPVKRGDKYETPKPYEMPVVRDVVMQALLRGLRPTGNEINIIAGNLYVTKEGYERLLREFPGLAGLSVEVGVPAMAGEGALVPCRAAWELNGKPDLLLCEKSQEADYRIPIRVNAMMGADAIQGKAKSKMYRRIYERLTGTALPSEEDADGANVIDGTAKHISHSEKQA